jgi:hypothetical protein
MSIPVGYSVCPYCRRKKSETDPVIAGIAMFICIPGVFGVIGGVVGNETGMTVGLCLGGALVVASLAFMKWK